MELFLRTENTRLRPQTQVNKGSCITSSGRAEQFLLLAPFPCTGLSTQTSRTKAKCCSLECSHGMNLNSSSQLGTASHLHWKSTWMMSLFSTELGILLLPLEALFHGALTLTLQSERLKSLYDFGFLLYADSQEGHSSQRTLSTSQVFLTRHAGCCKSCSSYSNGLTWLDPSVPSPHQKTCSGTGFAMVMHEKQYKKANPTLQRGAGQPVTLSFKVVIRLSMSPMLKLHYMSGIRTVLLENLNNSDLQP